MKTRVVIALGANLGDKEKTISKAQKQIGKLRDVELVSVSSQYCSQAVTEQGIDPNEPEYVNAVTIIETTLSAKKLLSRLNEIENKFGRVRSTKWAARTLDLDIITFGASVVESKSLVIPHPRAFERAFVLVPWLEIDPEPVLTGVGPVSELAKDMDSLVWAMP